MLRLVKGNLNKGLSGALPYLFMLVAALSRWPGLFPPNFSALYGLAFCAGVFFPGRMKWWLPFGTLVLSDICLDFYYLHRGYAVFDLPLLRYQLINYLAFRGADPFGAQVQTDESISGPAGRRPHRRGSVLSDHEQPLPGSSTPWQSRVHSRPSRLADCPHRGTAGWPQTWEFFRNTLLSAGSSQGYLRAP